MRAREIFVRVASFQGFGRFASGIIPPFFTGFRSSMPCMPVNQL